MAAVISPTPSPEDNPKPAPKDFKGPVAWLFGRQYIAALKWMLVYAAFKGKLDPRDWMKADCIPAGESPEEVDQFWRQWNPEWDRSDERNPGSEKEFWFDYISDTGDGQKAVYSIAYLCMSDLVGPINPQLGDPLEFERKPDRGKLVAEGVLLLKRGTFLFVGGDTSYHISDYATLANRFQNPFRWACDDLRAAGARSVMSEVAHPLFGIPGNHDYYDSIDGFNRQFRRPAGVEGGYGDSRAATRSPLLEIPTFGRYQEASYLALRLPFDWSFWALDIEGGEIDFRQKEFFDAINVRHQPQKLIVATAAPTTVFGQYAKEDENQSKTFKALGLERPFLKKSEPIEAGKCRVDLSGDVHHYARHWGPPVGPHAPGNYTSVVSGGGGAFLHPTQTNVNEVPQQILYPQAGESRKKVAAELFKIQNIFKGGFVWLFGFLIAFSLFFAASFPRSTRDAHDSFPLWINLGISPPVETQSPDPLTAFVKPMPRYTWGPNAPKLPSAFFLWVISLIVSVGLIGTALFYSSHIFKKEYDPTWKTTGKEVKLSKRLLVWVLVFGAFASLCYGILGFRSYEPFLTRYARSLIILAALIWAVLAIVQSIRYSAWLFEESYRVNIQSWHYWPIWTLMIFAVSGFSASLWFFGKHESAFLVSDIAQVLILLIVGGGLIYFAYSTGAKLKRGLGKVGFLLLGASHALLQLAVPFLLVRKGHLLWAATAALVAIIVFQFIGRWFAGMASGWPVAIAWVILGATLLIVPFIFQSSQDVSGVALNMPEGTWERFLLCFYAGAIGAVVSCVLFGWYLAVSLAFDGHNNEAGGAARIEGFKEFIRFRLNREGLTGYVIGIDEPETVGSLLKPKIVDVFHISP